MPYAIQFIAIHASVISLCISHTSQTLEMTVAKRIPMAPAVMRCWWPELD